MTLQRDPAADAASAGRHEAFRAQLARFEPITLEEMERVRLMNRVDTKFVFSLGELPGILEALQPHYRALETAGTRVSRYETLYYDTEDFDLYHRHQLGRASRVKVRARRYVESGICFLEVKRKNNKGRTIKERIPTTGIEEIVSPEAGGLFRELTHLDPARLKPAMWVGYGRITLVGRVVPERLTIDVGLHFHMGARRDDRSALVIAELKRDQSPSRSPALDLFRHLRIKQGSVSKYCLALAATNAGVRSNNFKQRFRRIERITHAA
jgi:hypothetical protein